jgi:tetratricopeptide (TPR) repeat protein
VVSALSCPSCGADTKSGAQFCTNCGHPIVPRACHSCGQPLRQNMNFCTNCGSSASILKLDENASALDHLIAAIQQLVKRSSPDCILSDCAACLRESPVAKHAAIASVLSMSCCARFGKFAEAEQALLQSRAFYARHLGLPADHQAEYVASGYIPDEFQLLAEKDIRQNPWLYDILSDAHRPSTSGDYRGDTEAEKREIAIEVWSTFFSDSVPIKGVLACLLFENGQYNEAATLLESLLLIARKFEGISPVRIELAWPRTILGECYWANGQSDRAIGAWKSVRSLDHCILIDPEIDDWSRLAVAWIERAKSRLSENNIPVPSQEDSLRSSECLKQAVRFMIEAEQFTDGGQDFVELSNMIQRAGRRYTDPIQQAAANLEAVERLDPFIWTKCPTRDSYFWCRYELAKSLLFQKYALLHVSNDKVALAVASYKQANALWPSVTTYGVMGGLQAACGLVSDAKATYRTCIDRAEEFGSDESSEARAETLKEIEQALRALN